MGRKIAVLGIGAVCLAALGACEPEVETIPLVGDPSPYLFLFLGDGDAEQEDFLTVLDLDKSSETFTQPVAAVPTGQKNSMPHHMEYVTPPQGEPIFMNAHMPETTFVVDVSDPKAPAITTQFQPPSDLRFPHDYTRAPAGTRLVGYLRSEGAGPDGSERAKPGNHGGIAEYRADGTLVRTASAAAPSLAQAMRPYAFAMLPQIDRFVVTSAPMIESTWSDVVQIFNYSDFTLAHTIELPEGALSDGTPIPGARRAGFGPRVLDDGSVFMNTYGCAFYHLSQIGSDSPSLEMVYAIETEAVEEGRIRGACGIPVRVGNYWLQPVGKLGLVMVLDLSDPAAPTEVMRLEMPEGFNPHWLAKDPSSNRLVLGAEFGGEEGFMMLRVDENTGKLAFDTDFEGKRPGFLWAETVPGYISLTDKTWPHADSGAAWGHAALFLPAGE